MIEQIKCIWIQPVTHHSLVFLIGKLGISLYQSDNESGNWHEPQTARKLKEVSTKSLWGEIWEIFAGLVQMWPWPSQLCSHSFLATQSHQRKESFTSSPPHNTEWLGSCSQEQFDAFTFISFCLYFNQTHSKHTIISYWMLDITLSSK